MPLHITPFTRKNPLGENKIINKTDDKELLRNDAK